MDLELVAVVIYTRRCHPCCRFSDPYSPVSVFTVVSTTTACHHTGRCIRQMSLVVEEVTKPLFDLKTVTSELSLCRDCCGDEWKRTAMTSQWLL
ncbi:hypothetical protein DY000_02012624 [Brassica cretica]|uniref:Uncharacterized protein n=1 Tax=Brassica cretica TaxID=69181 RepID=A0ABQ7D4W4_BRACR|nr:hypothetical protein DY000_02012624 [Brassica cretica]